MKKDETAPAPLEPVRLFVNSVEFDPPGRADEFASAEGASAWLRSRGIYEGNVTAEEAAHLRELRETIRSVLLAHNGDANREAADRALATALSGASATWCRNGETLGLEPAGASNLERIRSTFAIAIYDAMANGTWPRLKACRKDTCLYAFFDHSKNGSGTWCSMSTCGNRVKAAKRRQRSAHRH